MPNTKQPEQNKNLLEYHNKQLWELSKIQLFVDIEVNLLKKWNSLKTIQDLENLLSQSKLETLEEYKQSIIKQIKELKEEPTRQGIIDLINYDRDYYSGSHY